MDKHLAWIEIFMEMCPMPPEIKSPQQAFEYMKKHLKENYAVKFGHQGLLEAKKNSIAFERLLAHLHAANNKVRDNGWALKGGLLMNIRFPDRSRATKDIDLAMWGVDKSISYAELKKILVSDLNAGNNGVDMFTFVVTDAKGGNIAKKEQGVMTASYHIDAMLGKNKVTSFLIDIGLESKPMNMGDASYQTSFSEFMGYAATVFPAISKEQHFAEKLHAYSRPSDRFTNMRFKDLFDLSVFTESNLDKEELNHAMKRVFDEWGTHDIPPFLSEPPEQWRHLYDKLAAEHGLDEDMDASFAKLASYYNNLQFNPESDTSHDMGM